MAKLLFFPETIHEWLATENNSKTIQNNSRMFSYEKEIEQAVKQVVIGPNEPIEEAAKQVAIQPSQPTEVQQEKPKIRFKPTIKQLSWLIRFFNFVLIPAITLYCLTILFGLKISLLGRLGGINHISRAFFLSLLTLVLILPWQMFFGPVIAGVLFTPNELIIRCEAVKTSGLFGTFFHYLRFTGYWFLTVLILVFSYIRTIRWSKAMLRRLEVV